MIKPQSIVHRFPTSGVEKIEYSSQQKISKVEMRYPSKINSPVPKKQPK
jgi:hypothetical protein